MKKEEVQEAFTLAPDDEEILFIQEEQKEDPQLKTIPEQSDKLEITALDNTQIKTVSIAQDDTPKEDAKP